MDFSIWTFIATLTGAAAKSKIAFFSELTKLDACSLRQVRFIIYRKFLGSHGYQTAMSRPIGASR